MKNSRTILLAGASLIALVTAACGSDDSDAPATVETAPTSVEASPTGSSTPPGVAGNPFRVPGGASGDDNAFTYDEAAVPVGSVLDIESEEEDGRTTISLNATGLAPSRDYGVHVHTKRCGSEPADSGPHYQNSIDPAATPETPSSDPAFANALNEVWLDITTDANGKAQASTTVAWEFRDDEANSVVVHAKHTMTAPGEAGMAGDRLACIDEDF